MSRWFRGFYEEMLRAGDMLAAAGQQSAPAPDRQGEIRAMAGERTVCGEISIITARKANAPRIHGR